MTDTTLIFLAIFIPLVWIYAILCEMQKHEFFYKRSKLRKFFHIHSYSKPIVSSYVSFSSRDVVFECRCGCRKLFQETRRFGDPFSLDWTCNLNSKEMQQVLDRNESEELLIELKIRKEVYLKTSYK